MKTEQEIRSTLNSLERLDNELGKTKNREIAKRILKWVLEDKQMTSSHTLKGGVS